MSNEELPTGASVFGNAELPTGASVFADAPEPGSTSVFADVDPDVSVDDVPSEAIDTTAASVFDTPQANDVDDSPDIGDWKAGSGEDLDLTDKTAEGHSRPAHAADDGYVDAPDALDSSEFALDSEKFAPGAANIDDTGPTTFDPISTDAVLIDDGADDPIDLFGESPGFGNDVATGEAIALDVEPTDEEGLGAWSDLGSAAPAWGDDEETTTDETADSWDPGLVEEEEPAVVKIGGDESERFFGYDGQPTDNNPAAATNVTGTGSEMQSRIATGVGLLALAVLAIYLGPLAALALIVIVVALSAGEFYNALRLRGYNPATLLGLSASVAMPLAVYFRGTQAVALVAALAIVFGLLWYLFGVGGDENVAMNLGVTLLGVAYIGVLGSFGAAMLETAGRLNLAGEDGTGLLFAAVILTIGYDVGAFFSGRSMGRTPLTAVSPNKTVEGLVGGAVMTVVASVVFLHLIDFIEPFASFGGWTEALVLGVAAAIMAPLGDLGESLLKRDLGIKDMGSILPGHGGFLDRFDALLFVLPTVYFVSLAFFYN